MRVRDEPLDGPCGAVSGSLKITITRRQPAGYQHQSGRVQRCSLVDCLAVLDLCSLRLSMIRGRKESAAAQRRDAQAGLGHQPTGLVESHLGELFPPDPDRAEADVDATLDRLRQRPGGSGPLVEGEAAEASALVHRARPAVASSRPTR